MLVFIFRNNLRILSSSCSKSERIRSTSFAFFIFDSQSINSASMGDLLVLSCSVLSVSSMSSFGSSCSCCSLVLTTGARSVKHLLNCLVNPRRIFELQLFHNQFVSFRTSGSAIRTYFISGSYRPHCLLSVLLIYCLEMPTCPTLNCRLVQLQSQSLGDHSTSTFQM